jgi:hypothetical protein
VGARARLWQIRRAMQDATDAPWLTGGCHCGAVRFRVRVSTWRLVDCNCSICTKKGFLHLIVPKGAFIEETDHGALAEYRFNTGTARHWFCKRCGIAPFYAPRSHPEGISVNARCLDAPDLGRFAIEPFDGQHWEAARGSLG